MVVRRKLDDYTFWSRMFMWKGLTPLGRDWIEHLHHTRTSIPLTCPRNPFQEAQSHDRQYPVGAQVYRFLNNL